MGSKFTSTEPRQASQRVVAIHFSQTHWFLVAAVLIAFGVAAYVINASRLTSLRVEYVASRQAAEIQEQVFQTSDQLSRDDRFRHGILPPAAPELSTSAVLARARRCIQNAGGTIESSVPIAPVTDNTVTEFGVRITASMNTNQFDATLSQLELGQPALFIRAIDIQTSISQQSKTSVSEFENTRDQTYQIELVAFGSIAGDKV